jgi:hypothetical protein
LIAEEYDAFASVGNAVFWGVSEKCLLEVYHGIFGEENNAAENDMVETVVQEVMADKKIAPGVYMNGTSGKGSGNKSSSAAAPPVLIQPPTPPSNRSSSNISSSLFWPFSSLTPSTNIIQQQRPAAADSPPNNSTHTALNQSNTETDCMTLFAPPTAEIFDDILDEVIALLSVQLSQQQQQHL